MRTLYDIYAIENCGAICSTPTNTMGMGNPIPAGDGQLGSEPIIPTAKTKTEKKQKHKTTDNVKEGAIEEGILDDNAIEESILSDMEVTFEKGDAVIEFAEWYVTNLLAYYNKFDKSELVNNLLGMISIENNNTVIIDVSKDKSNIGDSLVIKNSNIPRNIKTIKFINANKKVAANIYVMSYVCNLSKINIEVYVDDGKSFGNIIFKARKNAGQHLMLGKITCDMLDVDFHGDSLSINNDSVILDLSLKHACHLTNFYGKLSHLSKFSACKLLIQRQLSEAGILPWGVKLEIHG